MSTQNDTARLIDPRDVPAALGLLTRLPIKVDADRATTRGADAAWAYPVVGLCVGLVACCVAQIALSLGLPTAFAGAFALLAMIITTGAMHEDGLADCADGFWGAWDREKRLAIMKDSQIGTYGTIALVLSLGLRWGAMTALIGSDVFWTGFIAIAMLSRAVMVPLMSLLVTARTSGLSQSVGRPARATALIAVAIAGIGAIVLLQGAGFMICLFAAITAIFCALIARAKIGGQTGDVLGATQQITEIICLITLTSMLA